MTPHAGNSPTRRGAWLLTPRVAIAALAAALLLVTAATFYRYGFTIDDDNGLRRAGNILDFLGSRGADSGGVGAFTVTNFYGAMPDVVALLLQRLFPPLGIDSRHLVAALFGIVGIVYAGRLAAFFGDRWAGPVAAALLSLNPMWFGYMFINIKDIPFATGFLALSYHGLSLFADRERPPPGRWLMFAVWSGLAATTKLLGIPMAAVAVLVMLALVWSERGGFNLRSLLLRLAGAAAAVTIGTAAFAAVFWPQLFLYRPDQLVTVLRTFMDFTPYNGPVLLDGETYDARAVPHSYGLVYLAISMPLPILGLYLAALPLAVLRRRVAILGPVAVPLIFLAIQVATHAQIYNGYRHFIFVLPFVAVAAGCAFTMLAAAFGGRQVVAAAAAAVLAIFAGVSITGMVRLFPYEYSSYNLLVGGTSGAQGRFYIDVWRSAEREALQRIAAASSPDVELSVFSCGSPLNFTGLSGVAEAQTPVEADFFVALPRGCPVSAFPGAVVINQVRRGDVVFASILARP